MTALKTLSSFLINKEWVITITITITIHIFFSSLRMLLNQIFDMNTADMD